MRQLAEQKIRGQFDVDLDPAKGCLLGSANCVEKSSVDPSVVVLCSHVWTRVDSEQEGVQRIEHLRALIMRLVAHLH